MKKKKVTKKIMRKKQDDRMVQLKKRWVNQISSMAKLKKSWARNFQKMIQWKLANDDGFDVLSFEEWK